MNKAGQRVVTLFVDEKSEARTEMNCPQVPEVVNHGLVTQIS